jgi:signal peptidase II
MPKMLQSLASSRAQLILAFVMLVLSLVTLDQSTKLHSEKQFLSWSHPTEVHQIHSAKHHVLTLGTSPSQAFRKGLPTSQISSNWIEFHLTYVRNVGAAWGALSSLPSGIRTPFFSIVTILALAMVVWLFSSSHPGQRLYRIGLCFIFAGAIGNFVDRMALGYVIDWLHFHWKVFGWEYSFPVFNIADICINVGVGIILIDLLSSEVQMRSLDHDSKDSKKSAIEA